MDSHVNGLLDAMSEDLTRVTRDRGIKRPIMIGIHTGGAWIAQRLHDLMNFEEPLGLLDISFYRDDFSRIGVNPRVKPSSLPLSVDDRHIILVDDVLFTGRTIRAALNEIFDYGRPASVTLAALIERDGRELPIEASVVGHRLKLASHQHVKLGGPDPLNLRIVDTRLGGNATP
ncbi:MAG: bifunctional pyr operon transcriptional regulator/uracil phosphoribosyltransferase PyrR [Gammaproteobacteria bacterium]|nr:bifunctional pyr operon transcriptional regulator/uracil phosphoribosyltransferase PyrR [Gammaproteobacteria bacterium]MBA3732542.1 bifunctional pyr operon transcriptional regulator/uracil phosphoribosyltransferase PyrR [Gammaproteobacteria bacterium]